jgi:hypothetical protein
MLLPSSPTVASAVGPASSDPPLDDPELFIEPLLDPLELPEPLPELDPP